MEGMGVRGWGEDDEMEREVRRMDFRAEVPDLSEGDE